MTENAKAPEVQTNNSERRDHPWHILSRVDVKDRIEKKNGLSYISWAWAWGTLKDHFPDSWFRKNEAANGIPYFIDMQGYAYVKVTVGLDLSGDYEITETFPVLDHRNKPIVGPSSFDVNNALQRCLAKCIAYHGLGHYIYAGEDVPQDVIEPPAEARKAQPERQAPTQAQQPSSPPPSAPLGVDDGKGNTIPSEGAKMVHQTLLAVIAGAPDEPVLKALYARNKDVIDKLKVLDAEGHAAVMAAFKARKAELSKPTEGA
jgi:hypothetical protein